MARNAENLRSGVSFSSADFGSTAQWQEHTLQHPRRGEVRGKVFLGKMLGLTGMEASLTLLQPGEAIPFAHAHKQNEELYLVVSGQGEFQVDGETFPIKAGTAIRVAPAGMRCLRATGSEPMAYVVIQAKEKSLLQATGDDGIISPQAVKW